VFPPAPGLDDGAIFPSTHFPPGTAAKVISNSGLARTPLRGVIQVAVILVDFEDAVMRNGPKVAQRFRDLFFSASGSVSQYYAEVSGNSISRFDGNIVGPFRMPHPRSYYANNSFGREKAPNARNMASDAYDAAINALGDLKKYDNDNNGQVDAFIVVHAGRGAEESGLKTDIWSLKWSLPTPKNGHGAIVSQFLTVPEDAKLGVCVHEIGHLVFGWPDLYDSNPEPTGEGIGQWCLMSSGSWGGGGDKPVHPSAWCKAAQGWVNVDNVTFDRVLDIGEVKISNTVYRLWRQGQANTDEYYLVENRTKIKYDEFLPGQGLLSMFLLFSSNTGLIIYLFCKVWHILESKMNNQGNPYKVALVQADNRKNLEVNQNRGDAGDPFPGSSGNTSFTLTSNPSSKAYNGEDTFVSIRDIPSSSETMRVKVGVAPNPFLANFDKGLQDGIEGFDLKNPADDMLA